MLTPNKRAYCTLARDYQSATSRLQRRHIDNQMRALETSDGDVNVLAMCYTDAELIDLLSQDEHDTRRLTRALLIALCDRVDRNDEFFDTNGTEYVVGTTGVVSDTTATIELGGTIFDVTITEREV